MVYGRNKYTFKRHFENYGRFNSSVADSSWDLWLDGYEAGIPHRKVSIYVKGALIALILDLKIILESNGERSLDDVMRKLWTKFYKKNKGYSSDDYLKTAEEVIGYELTDYSNKFITGCEPVENELKHLLRQFGFDMELKANENQLAHHFGLKINDGLVVGIAPASPAEKAFRIGDKLISIDDQKFEEIESTIQIEVDKSYNFKFFRNNNLREVTIKTENGGFYSRYILKENNDIKEDDKMMRKSG